MSNPYKTLPPSAFWRPAVAEVGPFGLEELWEPRFQITPDSKIATAGSCFAQHFSRALVARGYTWLNTEPVPPWLSDEVGRHYGYGVFSFRTGNIYTPRMLRQWMERAFGVVPADDAFWHTGERWFDPLRPMIEPDGFASEQEVREARAAVLASLRNAVREADVFVFTLGLTECWRDAESGLEYALCPGTTAGGTFDPERHEFHNAGFVELLEDLQAAMALMRAENRALKILLTVSPVPLVASASGGHVLIASSHSKSLLRAVASQAVLEDDACDYFPSYEIITHPIFRGMFFKPNMREVEPQGVETVMGHFFANQARVFGEVTSAELAKPKPARAARRRRSASDVLCEEELLDAFKS